MGVQINGSEGNVVATKGTYSGNVTIGGTLTYEDVTNIDSVGLVTARTGIEIGARPGVGASISVDGNAIFSGITTAVTLKATTGIVTTLTATTGIVTTFTTNTAQINTTTLASTKMAIQSTASSGSGNACGLRIGNNVGALSKYPADLELRTTGVANYNAIRTDAGDGNGGFTAGVEGYNGFLNLTTGGTDVVNTKLRASGVSFFNAGNVGIGNTNPGELLSLRHATSDTVLDFECLAANNGTTGNIIKFRGKGANGVSYHASQIKGITENSANNAGFLSFWTNSAGTVGEKVRITSGGNLLVGKTSGTSKVDVDATDNTIRVTKAAVTNYCGFQLDRDNSGNAGGYLGLAGVNNNYITNSVQHDICLRSQSNLLFSSNGATERMRLDTSGRLLLNISSAISTDYAASVYITSTGGIAFKPDGTSTRYPVAFKNSSDSYVGSISITTTNTQYNTSSDYRLKENEIIIPDAISKVKQLKPYRFNFKTEPSKTVDGFFAHEAQEVVSYAVTGEKDAEDMQQMDYGKLTPLLTAALQEAVTEIESLKARLDAAGL